eukprot:CAMPEP_0185595566 /NCGR_PEP_ID=MMETSP0434-20130131/78916_1 /TAXON_ID=626734 ORGANISM="Favella taraikaensis, Strain Fe Narragansett Bay" /NCGR_SAMPLE_ID=MMETSP0434 /ASSEMBLY_ACC=CAM_ASM_000379 /LENGTH=136 /DNA_ID=CAMNT_0028223671 /DNA_START=130 /DNA_END=540 /DNA_ORIENTATION=-
MPGEVSEFMLKVGSPLVEPAACDLSVHLRDTTIALLFGKSGPSCPTHLRDEDNNKEGRGRVATQVDGKCYGKLDREYRRIIIAISTQKYARSIDGKQHRDIGVEEALPSPARLITEGRKLRLLPRSDSDRASDHHA